MPDPTRPEQRPAFDPKGNPVKLKCEGNVVFGWYYPADSTIELRCSCKICRRRGSETRHLFGPDGKYVNAYKPTPEKD